MNINQAKRSIELCIKSGLVAILKSSPGLGKSALIAQIAEDMDATLIDLRLTQLEAIDLAGLVYPDEDSGTFTYLPSDVFPLEGVYNKPDKPVVLFLDEFNSASKEVAVASYKLVLDRMIGQYSLHDNVHIVCAGNLDTDKAITTPMSSALKSRLVHLELEVSLTEWKKWALANGIHHLVSSFLEYQPSKFYTFDAYERSGDSTYACPRSWHMLSNLLHNIGGVRAEHLALINGVVGSLAGTSFLSYCTNATDIPSNEDIILSPLKTKVPKDIGKLYAVLGNLNSVVKNTNVNAIAQYINRMPMEYQTVFFKTLATSNPILLKAKCVQDWVSMNHNLFN